MTIVTRCFYALQNTLLPMVVSTVMASAPPRCTAAERALGGVAALALAGSLPPIAQMVGPHDHLGQAPWSRRAIGSTRGAYLRR